MLDQLVECVPNFSEGRDPKIVDTIADAIGKGPGVAILGLTMDADHNRSVITFAGTPQAVGEAALRGVGKAVELIDLNNHSGVHPRLGAADVLPFIPIRDIGLPGCVELAHHVGAEIWERLSVPVYFYEAAARTAGRERLENVRRGGFERIRELVRTDPTRLPDIGGPALHPTAGAVIVGARKFLIAWNINIASDDLSIAEDIARLVRASSGGLPHVKALGLPLLSRKQVQVSMNLTDFETTPMHVVWETVARAAQDRGVQIAESELIGYLPKAAVEDSASYFLRIGNFRPELILENRLLDVLPTGMKGVIDSLADPGRSYGGASAAAWSAAMAAALGALVARIVKTGEAAFLDHSSFFSNAAETDAQTFARLLREPDPDPAAYLAATEVPLAIADRARQLHAELVGQAAYCPPYLMSDVVSAKALALAAIEGAIATAELNVESVSDLGEQERLRNRISALKSK